MRSLDIHELPEIPSDSGANGDEREEADHLAAHRAGEACTRREEPEPPGLGKGSVAELMELDVGEEGERHKENEGSVKEDESGFNDMEIVC
jgi:hypothetical protein